MTNEQLRIVFESQAKLFEKAIDEAVLLMPEDAERELEWWRGDKRVEIGFSPIDRYDDDQRPTGNYVALSPIIDHCDMMMGQLEILDKPPTEKGTYE